MKKIITILIALAFFGFLLGCVAQEGVDDTTIPDTTIPDPSDIDDMPDEDFEIDIDSEIEETIIDEDDDINVGEMF